MFYLLLERLLAIQVEGLLLVSYCAGRGPLCDVWDLEPIIRVEDKAIFC